MPGGSDEDIARRLEILTALLLGLAAVGSSVSAYLSARWGSLESLRFGEANAFRSESVRASNRAFLDSQVDVSAFVATLSAYFQGNSRLADYLAANARAEFRPALDAWLRRIRHEDRGQVRALPGTPFALPGYVLSARAKADRLQGAADEALAEARRANVVGTNYVVPTVLFSTVLFLLGICTKMRSVAGQRSVLLLSLIFFLGSLAVLIAIPYL